MEFVFEKRRVFNFVIIIISILDLLFLLTPFIYTKVGNDLKYFSGYEALFFLSDKYDLIYQGTFLILIFLILSIFNILFSVLSFFLKEDNQYKNINSLLTIFLILKMISLPISEILISNTKTNVQLAFGIHLSMIINILFTIFSFIIYIKYMNNKELLKK